jgi:hypothetical protein
MIAPPDHLRMPARGITDDSISTSSRNDDTRLAAGVVRIA